MRLRLLALAGLFSAVFLLCCTVLLVTIVPAHAYNPAHFPGGASAPAVQANGDSTIEFSSPSYTVIESGGFAVISATRTGNPALPATVTVYRTGGTATNHVDFELNTAGSRDFNFSSSQVITNNFIAGSASLAASFLTLADGKIIVGGFFDYYKGVPVSNIVQLLPNGSVNPNFNASSNGLIFALAKQTDGKILVGGDFTTFNGQPRNRLVRLNTDGTLDNTFNVGEGASEEVFVIKELPEGKILIGGGFNTFNNLPRSGIVRLNSNGSVDTDFNPGTGLGVIGNSGGPGSTFPDKWVGDIDILPDNKIIASGTFTEYNNIRKQAIVRLNPDGSLDTNFSLYLGYEQVFAVTILADNKLLVARTGLIARYNFDGSLDNTFSSLNTMGTFQIMPNGKIIVIKYSVSNDPDKTKVLRLNNNGTLDSSFKAKTEPNCDYNFLEILPYDNVLLGGRSSNFRGEPCYGVVKLYGDLNFNWAAGEGGNKTITVPIITDDLLEGSETLQLALTNTVGATLGEQVTATLTILDDETLPSLSISDTSVLEGNSGSANAIFTVTLNTTSPLTTTVSYSTVNGTAMGGDYIPQSGVITFSPGITHQLITVTVNGDRQIEPDETFSVLLSNPVNATLAKDTGVATILADDATVQWSSSIYTYNESAGLITLKANRVGATSGVVTAQIVITNVTTSVADYNLPPSNVLTWGDGESGEKSLGIFLINDTLVESTESAQLGLIASDNATVGSPAVVTLFIEDNDVPPCEPLLVTKSNDDGAGTLCGTLSFALSQPVTTSNAYTITFALTDTRTITFSGALTGAVKAGVTLDGGTDPEPIVLNGNGITGDGLQLTGGNALRNLRVRNFDGRQIVTNGTGNRFERLRAERNGS
jgi:uncharacterized delta-60 repeat protein